MRQTQRQRLTGVFTAWLAPFLVLFAPFLSYAQYQNHGFGNSDVLVFALILAVVSLLLAMAAVRWPLLNVIVLAGLLTFLVDIQSADLGLKRLGLLFIGLGLLLYLLRRHASRIVASGMVALVVSLLLLPVRFEAKTTGTPHAQGRGDLPLVVHLLLDEMIGVEGIPEELAPPGFKRDLEAFFVERGFRLFGRAYSQYPATVFSVAQLLNFSTDGYRDELSAPGPSDGTFRLTRNAFFEEFARRGYAIKVHQPDYLYVCPEGVPASCRTYASRSLNLLNALDVPLSARLSVVAGTFFGQSEAYRRTKDAYRLVRPRLAPIPLPAWNWDRGIPASASSQEMFDAVAEDLRNARGGTLVFAHILLPHYPYVYDSSCRSRPANEWMERRDPEVGGGSVNVPTGRSARYAAYLQQVTCAQRQLARLLDSIPESLRRDAVVIIQGDHGSRITIDDPTTDTGKPPAPSDLVDSYSTMFAVRSCGITAGYDLQAASITCLLRGVVLGDFGATGQVSSCATSRPVYLLTEGKPSQARRLPEFGTGGDAGPTSLVVTQTPALASPTGTAGGRD